MRIGGLMAGASKVTITPKGRVFLAGLSRNRRSVGLHDDLWARCLAITLGGETIILVSLDLIGLFRDQVELIRDEAEENGLRGESITVACTHQHSGPDTLGLWDPDMHTPGVDEGYMAYLRGRVLEAILEAVERAEEATIRLASTSIPKGVARNTRNPGFMDPEISVMEVRTLKGDTIAVLINFGLHPEVLWSDNRLLTADFPNYLYQALEDELGGVAIFMNGALGGMVTPDVKEHTFEEAERIGRTIAEAALRALREKSETGAVRDLEIRRETLTLPVENERFRTLHDLGVLKRVVEDDAIETEVSLLRVGEAEILTIPGEALPRIGLQLKARMRGKYKFLVCLANDEIGYIIP